MFPLNVIAAGGVPVELVGGSLSHVVPNNVVARVELALTIAGEELQDEAGSGLVKVGNWLLFGSVGDFEARYLAVGDAANIGDPFNTWIDLGVGFNTGYNLTTNNTEWTANGTLEVRRKSTGIVQASVPLDLNVVRGNP